MLTPPSHPWTRRNKRFIVGAVLLALVSFGALIYGYGHYYRGPGESVFYGTWLDPLVPGDTPAYWEFRSDHTFAILRLIDGKKESDVEGRWYAGGPNIYLRFPAEYTGPMRPIVMHIVEISSDQFTVRLWGKSEAGVYRFQRVSLESTRASNQALRPTASARFLHAPGVMTALRSARWLILGSLDVSCPAQLVCPGRALQPEFATSGCRLTALTAGA